MIKVQCPCCHGGITCDDRYAGNVVLCPACKKQIQMPAVAQAIAVASRPAPSVPPVQPAPPQPTPEQNGFPVISVGPSPANSSGSSGHRSHIPKKRKKTDPTLFIVGGVIGLVALVSIAWIARGAFQKEQPSASPRSPDKSTASRSGDAPSIPVSGELFVTTKGGDVKKAAGQKIHFTPITPDLQQKMASAVAKANQSLADWDHVYDECHAEFEKSPEYSHTLLGQANDRFDEKYGARLKGPGNALKAVVDSGLSTLLTDATTVVTDSDGKFKLDLPAGRYVLWTPPRAILSQSFSWRMPVEVRGAALNLILSEDSVFIYAESENNHRLIRESKCTNRLLREIASVVGK